MFSKTQLESISKNLHEVANIFETVAKNHQQDQTKSKRGRKPGTVPDEVRCSSEIAKGDRCKNRQVKDGFCGKHAK
jgi:hypothetical protein